MLLSMQMSRRVNPSHLLNILLLLLLLFLLFLLPNHYKDAEDYPLFPPVYTDYATQTNTTGHRLLCMVLTTPANYLTKAVHVQATWGRRCDTLLFISSSERGLVSWFITPDIVSDLPVLELAGVLGREHLWDKVKLGLSTIWRDYSSQFDFLIKADDDTFLIVDNLKHLLSELSPSDPLILGHHQEDRGVAYLSGGPGYVLSHAAVREIVEVGLGGDLPCHLPHPVGQEVQVYPNEDLQMGKCASLLHIPVQSSEVQGQSTFLPFLLPRHLVPGLTVKWWLDRTKECQQVVSCVSPALVSMHYVSPEMMYVYDYFVFGFRREI
eukprot:GFUD01108234.1.p1 GENE.GFUD01108234.1~~GFUD01108234.1.p1  ORF type:complete len:323 (+),score=98.26 GFUD01108234.1:167-1135(+)